LPGLITALWASHASAGETIYFAHDDGRYLTEEQHDGGAAFIPAAARRGGTVPLVVFLHGTNPRGVPHLWLGGLGRDLRPTVESLSRDPNVRPFVLAAPSQTTFAGSKNSLWSDFDLNRFVADVRQALGSGVELDEGSLHLFGHSGAGCNPRGGLATAFTGGLTPLSIVSIDPCLDEKMGRAFAPRIGEAPLWVLWQSQAWPRNVDAWSSALLQDTTNAESYRITHLTAPGPNPHSEIVSVAFEMAVRRLLKRERPPLHDDG
jgi:hypothetical protein